jgi:hypothetical protein
LQEKLLLFVLIKMPLYKGVLSTNFNRVSAPSLCYSLSLSLFLSLSKNKEDLSIFYMRGLFELFPPIYLPYSITLNGLSSPESDLDLSLTNIQGYLL